MLASYFVKATEYGTLGAQYVASHLVAITGVLGGLGLIASGRRGEGVAAVIAGFVSLFSAVDPSKV